jgi:hypothetical protein
MIVSIMQPAYLPWLGYFDRIYRSDLHVVLDHVQIDRNSKTKFANRNKIRTATGWVWLTVPLVTSGKSAQLGITQLEISPDARWEKKHLETIRHSYAKAPYFPEHRAFLQELYQETWTHLAPLLRRSTDYLVRAFGMSTPVVYSSSLRTGGAKDELILNICRDVGATCYLSGPFGRDYLSQDEFGRVGIELRFHDYVHPVYPQIQGGFEPYMSGLDLLLNCGAESLSVLAGKATAGTERPG